MTESQNIFDAPPTLSITLAEAEATALVARLEALAQTARIFGSGLADVDVRVGWSLEPHSEEIRWFQGPSGRRSVSIRLHLRHTIERLRPQGGDERSYVDAFKTSFLHELGHILYAPDPGGLDIRDETHLQSISSRLTERQRTLLANPELRGLLENVHHALEDGRIERNLVDSFRGAFRYLSAHAEHAVQVVEGAATSAAVLGSAPQPLAKAASALNRLVAILFLDLWGWHDRWDRRKVPPEISAAADRLIASLDRCGLRRERACLAQWVVEEVFPELEKLIQSAEEETDGPEDPDGRGEAATSESESARPDLEVETSGADDTPCDTPCSSPKVPHDPQTTSKKDNGPTKEDDDSGLVQLARSLDGQPVPPGLLSHSERPERMAVEGSQDELIETSHIIVYPHIGGGLVVDEISVATAREVPQTERVRGVIPDVARVYGPRALSAFVAEEADLRRAFQVNFERRFGGRFRSGHHIGIQNLRRYLVGNDLRIFQRMKVPDQLSYYFHLLLDVSPSMSTNKNLQKALAIGYAFTHALDRLRVPVDVSLYSSAITRLYDHRRDALDPYFGGSFGYLSSGTHEIEAIAYAKQVTERVLEERKIVVVITDGQPNGEALTRAGGPDLSTYYRELLIPWLHSAGIDLLAIGIGTRPSYHAASATISSGWESVGVLMRLLDEIIARGQTSHATLWR